MRLVKLIAEHLIPSLIIGITGWFVTDDLLILPVSVLTGWLIDADHLLDFAISRFNGNTDSLIRSIPRGSYFKYNGKIFILLHSWELAILWAVTWWWIGKPGIAIVGTVAWLIHLSIDQLVNHPDPRAYFLAYRVANRFKKEACRW